MAVRVAGCVAIAVMSAAIGGCGGSSARSSNTGTESSTTKLAIAQIKHNWVEFFAPSTSPATAITLLQNGTKFAAAVKAQAKSPFASELSATVSSVKLTSPTTATVIYTLKVAGQLPVPGLKNATGSAVKTGSTWQVADSTFCQLLKLQGPAPAACPKG
jgi:hypothetical protein